MQTKNYISLLCETIDFQTVLEVGSGFGALADQMLTDHAIVKYTACDPDLEACDFIQQNYYGKHTQLTTFPCKFENFMLGDTKFDLVLASHVLEQVDFNKKGDPFKILDKMCNSSKAYVIHTCIEADITKYIDYWKEKQNDFNVRFNNVDKIRRVILAEII